MDTQLIDRLAQEIRRVDGSNSLGAAALAEALMPFVAALQGSGGEVVARSDMQALYNAYVRLLESGRDRIMDLGGACDGVDVMERTDPQLIQARRSLATASPAQPSGFVLAPVASTAEMDIAGAEAVEDVFPDFCRHNAEQVWNAMIAATAPAPIEQEG